MDISREMRVRDVMTRGVITVSLDTPVNKIAKLMVEKDISGVAVIMPDGEVAGMISEIDIINFFDSNWDEITAGDIMSSFVRAIDPETTLRKAANIMKDLNIHRLLILSLHPTSGVPIAILTASDILKASFVKR